MFDPRPLCCSSLTTAVGGTTDTNFVDSAHPTVARIIHLFKMTTCDSVENNLELQPVATKVVKECEGLPVAIVTIAQALKVESLGVWRNALEELRSLAPTNIRGVSKNVYSCLKLSYNHLENNDAKSLF